MGFDSLEPYLAWENKGVIILCRTSNKGGSDLQAVSSADGTPLYLHVAGLAAKRWNTHGQCALVVGATFPRSEEHTSELQSLMRISYAVFCLKKKKHNLRIYISDEYRREQTS